MLTLEVAIAQLDTDPELYKFIVDNPLMFVQQTGKDVFHEDIALAAIEKGLIIPANKEIEYIPDDGGYLLFSNGILYLYGESTGYKILEGNSNRARSVEIVKRAIRSTPQIKDAVGIFQKDFPMSAWRDFNLFRNRM